MKWVSEARERLRGLFFRAREEAEMDEEMRFHLEMEAQRLAREEKLDPREARRRAGVAFGGVEKHKEAVRDARGLAWVSGLSLDLKLGVRMLVKHPGVTLVGGLGMAAAIAIGAVFGAANAAVFATLPFDEGERVVAIESWDAEINNQEPRILHDFAAWRGELRSVRELSAFRTVQRNLITPGRPPELVRVAEMTASGFRVPRVPPLLGRHLVPEDERPSSPPVVVIGHEVWRTRFDSAPDVVGRELRLGSTVHTVVGVMPEGFAFPVADRIWAPLRADPADFERRQGPAIQVFGRLAPGATLQSAQAEVSAAGGRAAAAFAETHARLRPRVVPYTTRFLDDMQGWEFHALRLMVTLLLMVVAVNVAILVYARTAMRAGEITVRSALGASRRRIVWQLFAEALVLAALAAAAGLGIARLALAQLDGVMAQVGEQMGGLPFWIEFRLSSGTLLFVVGLTVLAAVIVGVVPALKATGRRLQPGLSQLGGGTGMRMGRTWTALIVAQVAFAVAVMPGALFYAGQWLRSGAADPGFAAEELLVARPMLDREMVPTAEAEARDRAFDARYAAVEDGLVQRLKAEPGVSHVALSVDLPGQEPAVRMEVEGVPAPAGSAGGHAVRSGRVDAGFFEAFGVPVLAGRAFHPGDADSAASPVVVNQSFVREVLGGRQAVGRRIRYREGRREGGVMRLPDGVAPERWYEVVGVVSDFPREAMEPGTTQARLYHPLAPGELYPVNLAVRVRGTAPAAFAGRVREVAAGVDPTLRLHQVRPLGQVMGQWQSGMRMAALALGLVTLSVLLLSAAGLYALMSLTVAQRRKEIGIRTALGAQPRRILAGIFSRALRQVATGVAVGLGVAALLDVATRGGLMGGEGAILLPAVAVLMTGVGLLAAFGPARRGLRIQPMEALREE